MQVEVIERYRVYKGAKRHFWEIRVDGKIVEVTLFNPMKALDDMCKEIQNQNYEVKIEEVDLSKAIDGQDA